MKKRLIAYHLPQFHEIEENNEWWGKGYTEWTAVKKWKPYFKNHILRKPERLGYYDFMEPNIVEQQYEIASNYGIEGFCFWIYWFGDGKRLLEKPLEHLLLPTSKVKYCLAWANHSWFDKSKWKLLMKQNYLGVEDYKVFYKTLSPHFKNKNYLKCNGRLILNIFMPQDIPDIKLFFEVMNALAIEDGLNGFYFISDQCTEEIRKLNLFDAYVHSPIMFKNRNVIQKILEKLIRYHSWTFFGPMKYSYPKMMKGMYKDLSKIPNFIPTIFSGWDTTPRHLKRGVVLKNFTKTTFKTHVEDVFKLNTDNELVFIKSWNEWAEGNVLEPDDIFNDSLLKIIKEVNS